jgi:hypothetical protein
MPLPGLLYAQVVKTVRRRRLVRVQHRVVFGMLEAVQQVLAACSPLAYPQLLATKEMTSTPTVGLPDPHVLCMSWLRALQRSVIADNGK